MRAPLLTAHVNIVTAIIAIIAIIAMSVKGDDEGSELEEIFNNARISEKGLTKLANHELTDKEILLLLTVSEINSLKLAIADRARLMNVIKSLRPTPITPEPASNTPSLPASPKVATPVGETTGVAVNSEIKASSSGNSEQSNLRVTG